MYFVLPATSTPHPTSHLAPPSYEYPNQGYYHLHPNVPRLAVPPYPASQQRFFRQPSAEELQESEYRHALTVITNYHRRQIEKEAAIHRQQQAEAARQRHLASLRAEFEQRRRQEELLASHSAEVIRTQRARARLAAAERQLAVNEFLGRFKGAQPKASRPPHLEKRKPLPYALKQRLASGSATNLTSADSRPVHPENFDEDSAELVKSFLSSLFPDLVFHVRPVTSSSTAQPKTGDNGKREARILDIKDPKESAQKPGSADAAATSGSPNSLPIEETVIEPEQTQADRVTTLSSIEHIRNNFTKLQTGFILPAELDHYATSTDDHDETASVSSASSSDLTKLIPYTSPNKPVYKYEHELNELLEVLDGIKSHGDTEVRDKRKEVVKAVERALEGVERAVGEVVKKRLSFVASSTPATEEPLKGLNVNEDIINEVAPVPTRERVDAPATEQSTSAQSEVAIITFVEESSATGKPFSESDTPAVSDDATTTLHVGPSPTEFDLGPSALNATPESVEVPVTEAELTEPRILTEEEDTVDAFLLNEEGLPPSPMKKHQLTDSDTDDEVLVLVDDEEQSDWSEIEN